MNRHEFFELARDACVCVTALVSVPAILIHQGRSLTFAERAYKTLRKNNARLEENVMRTNALLRACRMSREQSESNW